jgi:hypothetical protein
MRWYESVLIPDGHMVSLGSDSAFAHRVPMPMASDYATTPRLQRLSVQVLTLCTAGGVANMRVRGGGVGTLKVVHATL